MHLAIKSFSLDHVTFNPEKCTNLAKKLSALVFFKLFVHFIFGNLAEIPTMVFFLDMSK